jgi:elongation factor G
MDGKNRNPINKLKAGDIGSTLKLKNTRTNHTLAGKGFDAQIQPIEFPLPRIRTAILTKNKSDDEKLGEVLYEIHMEDPTILVEYDREMKQVLLLGQGELHLAVTKWRLEHVYKMEIDFVKPRIPYRETILKPANASYRHKKQSGGAGQFGEVYIKIEPIHNGNDTKPEFTVRERDEVDLPWGGKLVFNNCITGGVIDSRFIPSIMKGVMDKMGEGPLTGSFVRDIAVSVYDGKMHPVDSNDISFKIAGMMAFREAFHQAHPQLLEPIYDVEIEMPEDLMGDVMSELQSRRSIITGMDSRGGNQVIKARTPLAELDKASVNLRSITQGRARMNSKFAEYTPVPAELQKKLTDDYQQNHHHHEV